MTMKRDRKPAQRFVFADELDYDLVPTWRVDVVAAREVLRVAQGVVLQNSTEG